jgi:type IV pilus assembly protein PilA
MLKSVRERREHEEGFTLIELMVVVLIIAILIAIAIPTFLGARERAQNRAAQSSLRNALTAAKTMYTDNSSYATATDANLPGVEPSLDYVGPAVASTGAKEVSVAASATEWSAAALSASGDCYWIKEDAAGGTTYGTGAACTGNAADAAAADSW